MLITVDIGNTNIVIAAVDKGNWLFNFRVATDEKKTGDEYFVIFNSLLKETGIDFASVEKVIISSVVPFLSRSIEKNMIRIFHQNPIMISHDINTGLVRDSIPSELGSDLLCNLAYGHYAHKSENVMIIDFGTALTFSTVNKNGEVKGVAIAPGLVTAVNALFGNTAQLPQVELKIPESALGRDSQSSIRAGIMMGYAGLCNTIIERTENELGERLYVIATGGLSKTISPLIGRIDKIDSFHTLRGLALIASLNK